MSTIIEKALQPQLKRHGLSQSQIRFWVVHPGGRKVIENVQQHFGMTDEQLRFSRSVLRNYGNMSAPTVMFVLDGIVHNGDPRSNDWGVMIALGSGRHRRVMSAPNSALPTYWKTLRNRLSLWRLRPALAPARASRFVEHRRFVASRQRRFYSHPHFHCRCWRRRGRVPAKHSGIAPNDDRGRFRFAQPASLAYAPRESRRTLLVHGRKLLRVGSRKRRSLTVVRCCPRLERRAWHGNSRQVS
jgi:hypothetical protein